MYGGSPADDATICTVVTPLHKRLAAINHRLVETLNPRDPPRWIIADVPELSFTPSRIATIFLGSHPVGRQFAIDWQATYLEVLKARHFELDAMADLVPGASVIAGPTVAQTIGAVAERHGLSEAEAELRLAGNFASHQHAAGLQAALSLVRTRYAVVMDPDFYVTAPGWIAQVIAHMRARGLTVFGAPWHPRWHQKQRRFPAPHLMVIDLERTGPVAELMAPGLRVPGDRFVSGFWRDYVKASEVDGRQARRGLLRRLGPAIGEDLRQRRSIGTAQDTAHALAAAVAAAGGRVGMATPVFREDTAFVPETVSPLQTGLWPEAILPERWRYRPRRRGAVSATGFREAGYPDMGARDWEEFMWRGAPFAFHLRGEPQRKRSWQVDHDGLVADLNLIMDRLGLGPIDAPQVRLEGLPSSEARQARALARLLSGDLAEEEIGALLPAWQAAAAEMRRGRAAGA